MLYIFTIIHVHSRADNYFNSVTILIVYPLEPFKQMGPINTNLIREMGKLQERHIIRSDRV